MPAGIFGRTERSITVMACGSGSQVESTSSSMGGNLAVQSSFIRLLPDRKIAAIVMSNKRADLGRIVDAAVRQVTTVPAETQANVPASAETSMYVGVYRQGRSELKIIDINNELWMTLGRLHSRMKRLGAACFAPEQRAELDICFPLSDETINRLYLHGRVYLREAQ
jgi:hypothetical protein